MLQLYSYFRSSAAFRVRIALNYKKVTYTQVEINLLSNEQQSATYLGTNPQGLVPALQLNCGTIINQSSAIIEWLEETYPENPLYPLNSIGKAQTRALSQIIACDIHPLNNLRVLKYLEDELSIKEKQRLNWYHHWISLGFTTIEKQLDEYLKTVGSNTTMVHVYLVPQVYNALRFGHDMSVYPNIMNIYQACNETDAFKLAMPELQPGYKM